MLIESDAGRGRDDMAITREELENLYYSAEVTPQGREMKKGRSLTTQTFLLAGNHPLQKEV